MAEFAHAASGLAGEIRASLTSEQFDLTNYTQSRVQDLIHSAFGSPLDAPTEMVRFTFVVGGGKLVRAKYDEELPKWCTAALRDIGFTEDRSAALDFSSQGTYKQQHDTGQNLKTIIVFPRVSCASSKSASGSAEDGPATGSKTSPEYIIAACELSTFMDVVASKARSWHQKKRMLKVLQDASDVFKSLEAKLVRGEPLSPAEQAVYDSNSGQDEQKITWLQSEIKSMVEKGQLTVREQAEVIGQIESNIAALNEEIVKAQIEEKPKKVATLQERLAHLTEKKDAVRAITPLTHHRLRLGDEILKLRLKLLEFSPLEEKQRQGGLTLAELKQLEPKVDIEARVLELELASKGWFENEEDFRLSCEQEERAAKEKYNAKIRAASAKKKSSASSSGSGSKSVGTSGKSAIGSGSSWSTIGVKKKVAPPPKAKPASSGFSALGGGEDSDDSDDN